MNAPQVLTKAPAAGAPDLVVEIGSPAMRRRDQTIKRRLYARSGVAEYWLVDPVTDVVRLYRRTGGGFDGAASCRAQATIC
jgi:Uma2 family endonuclease